MSEEAELELFQQVLAELLMSGLGHDEILQKLKADQRLDNYKDYIESFDPDMVAVASELMIKWARRKEDL